MAITELFSSTGFIATTSAPVSIAQATPSANRLARYRAMDRSGEARAGEYGIGMEHV